MATKNLVNKEAIDKLKELAEKARTCMMTTMLDSRPVPTRPMFLQEVSEDGNMWLISDKNSDKNHQIATDSEVMLYFMNGSSSEYLSIYGKATIYDDQSTVDAHWSKMAKAWFDGKEDPNVTIICIKPIESKYWDTKHGKIIDMVTMFYSAITNDQSIDGGISGTLKI